MCFRASPFLVLKVVGGVVGVVLGCAHRARRVSSLRFSAIFASGRCIWCYSIVQDGIRRQEQKTDLKNSLIQPRTSQKKFSLFENALRALRAFPKGKRHQKLRTFGYPPFMEKLKTKITCCSELWKWSPKTTLSGGVSCWHLPYQKSMCPQRTLKDT